MVEGQWAPWLMVPPVNTGGMVQSVEHLRSENLQILNDRAR